MENANILLIKMNTLQKLCVKVLSKNHEKTMKPLQKQLNHLCFDLVLQMTMEKDFEIWKENFKYVSVEIKQDEIADIYAEPTMICGDYFIDIWVKFHDDDEYIIYTQHNDEEYEYYYKYCLVHGLVNG